MEDCNIDIGDLNPDGEGISTKSIIEYMEKMQKEIERKMLSRKDLSDVNDRLKEIDIFEDRLSDLQTE